MSLWHCDAELCLMQNSNVNYHSRKNMWVQMLFHGPSLTTVCLRGKYGVLLHPRGTIYTPLRDMFSHSLPASSNVVIHMFLWNSRSALRPVKVGRNALSKAFFGRFFAHCTIIVRPIAYKSHSTPFLNRPHDLTPVSWVCDKRCGTSYTPKFVRKNNNKHTA